MLLSPKDKPFWQKEMLNDSIKEPVSGNDLNKLSQESLKKIENNLIAEIVEDPRNIEAYKKLGKLYYNQFKYEYAKESFEAAIKLGSGDKKIKNLLKKCYEKLGKKMPKT